ncbi:hypothetical protein QOZ96_001238 [Brevundimonas nasdae]|uniref:acyltransferase n=1 Tax=Brevundimonas nasdae TaxID=172043 RepID=UPI001911CFBD|nr:hypothetical protein [Brevundimonas nasdae]MBK6024741.1 hypothetical protein [Brevundimonas nasdae]MDQ0451295.1 hypothetical protein [Brevundimonas nasdae]
MADQVDMEPGARIGSLTYVKGLGELLIEENGRLGNLNWVTGLPKSSTAFFKEQPDRRPALVIRSNAAITHRHLIDCTDLVEIGAYATFAGWGSQILTHAIDFAANRQSALPVRIGAYAFVGTRCVFLKGAYLPERSILAAGSVLSTHETQTDSLYSGVRATWIKRLDTGLAYFQRHLGFVQ